MEPGGEGVSAQLRRGIVEFCVLALIDRGPMYGLAIAQALGDSGLLDSEGTLYPLLSRLRRRELVRTEWAESTSGPPRRYYELTDSGHRALDGFRAEWTGFRRSVDDLMGEHRDGRT